MQLCCQLHLTIKYNVHSQIMQIFLLYTLKMKIASRKECFHSNFLHYAVLMWPHTF